MRVQIEKIKNSLPKIEKIIDNLLFFVICACAFSCLVTLILSGKPNLFGYRPFFVMTDSMEPTILAHSLVVAVPISAEDVKVGDIVTYTRKATDTAGGHFHINLTVVHRVKAVNGDTFIFQGDNEAEPDPPVMGEQIGYRVVWVWR